MNALKESEQKRKLNKNAIMQFVQKFNLNKKEIQALEKDIEKKEKLAFEITNYEDPMITEMEQHQDFIKQQNREQITKNKAANYQRLKEEAVQRELERQAEIAENQKLLKEDCVQRFLAKNQQDYSQLILQRRNVMEKKSRQAQLIGGKQVVQNLPFDYFGEIDQAKASEIQAERHK